MIEAEERRYTQLNQYIKVHLRKNFIDLKGMQASVDHVNSDLLKRHLKLPTHIISDLPHFLGWWFLICHKITELFMYTRYISSLRVPIPRHWHKLHKGKITSYKSFSSIISTRKVSSCCNYPVDSNAKQICMYQCEDFLEINISI